ncbi:putative NADP-dependent oxidoreductase YfmJ [Candida viswanathii]|uniref:Putative NADP-dependent oxidoreductase YfmJ n=1 Tax=Candida viswanathii TaxID=5486 RepID=A0A367YNQ4_9ASCO|nr:putative NADP-dependent oxidoreductase YfmJ [Candida viswanathii]
MSAPKVATQVFLKNCPTGFINPKFNESDSTFEVKEVPIPELQDGQVLVKSLYFSNDPTQRTWLRAAGDDTPSYLPPVHEGTPMATLGLAEIVESKSDKYVKGDIVIGRIFWSDYAVLPAAVFFNKIDKSAGLPLEFYLSVLGMTTLTAFFGLTEVADMKKYLGGAKDGEKGPVVLVSAAAGATGSSTVQIAKHLLGASKVIGIAGSDDKCKWVESLGADLCVNYKTKDWTQQIDKFLAKDNEGVDVYFDCVGGLTLSYALTKMNKFGHVALCGAISGYNDHSALTVSTLPFAITNRLTLRGFIVGDFASQFSEAIPVLAGAIKEGKIKAQGAYHVEKLSGDNVAKRLEGIPAIWNLLFEGDKPNGKLLIKLD